MGATRLFKHQALPLIASTKRYLKTQALMGATRLASVIVIVQQLFSGGAFPFYFPDARRVAPIRASVSSSTKRYR